MDGPQALGESGKHGITWFCLARLCLCPNKDFTEELGPQQHLAAVSVHVKPPVWQPLEFKVDNTCCFLPQCRWPWWVPQIYIYITTYITYIIIYYIYKHIIYIVYNMYMRELESVSWSTPSKKHPSIPYSPSKRLRRVYCRGQCV